ncbi:hypothetical protein GA0061070_1008118 [Kosakonia oryziphila]|uniref:Uncharacterized protein n=1 Tax=Kosakonia oryziphila TaxID=1005667 RepID=A0A1C4BRG5_9ENTR|nr:hypothetical protein GA0061070_1008118 [Kosakonia oryziphila]
MLQRPVTAIRHCGMRDYLYSGTNTMPEYFYQKEIRSMRLQKFQLGCIRIAN